MQSKLRLCHCKLRLPAILTASQKCSCKHAFLLHGRIAGSLQGRPVHIRFVENNFAFSAVRKKHKDAFLFSYFCMTKRRVQGGVATSERRRRDGVYQKSARRTHAVLIPNHWRRARVSRASRAWHVRAANGRAKAGDFAALRNLILPRVRTYHTR